MIDLAGRLAAVERLLVATDLDGVIAPIVEDPHDSEANPDSLAALRRLAGMEDTVVAVVSGRDRLVLERLAAPTDGFILVGSHGAQLGEVTPNPEERELLTRTVAKLERLVERHRGLHVEPKTMAVAVHFRRVEGDKADAIAAVEAVAETWPAKLVTGKEVLEFALRHETKGDAVRTLAHRHRVTATVYLGDDVTDEDVFAVLGSDDVGIKVGDGDSIAAQRLPTTDDVARFLIRLADLRSQRAGSTDG